MNIKSEITKLVSNKFYFDMFESLQNCGNVSSYMKVDIEQDVDCIERVHLVQGEVKDRHNDRSPHSFLYVEPKDYPGNKPLVIDGTIEQFTISNKNNKHVNSEFGEITDFKRRGHDKLFISFIHDSMYNHKIH